MNKLHKLSDDELKEIVEQGYKARNILDDRKCSKFMEENKKYIGTYWKCRNRYSSGRDWWLYGRVKRISGEYFMGFRFEKTSMGKIEIEPDDLIASHPGWIKITKAEYFRAWRKIIDRAKQEVKDES